jgi:predicted dehydrogenase/threonine dehydrogenase-like Zn-dependent dehydrogenase
MKQLFQDVSTGKISVEEVPAPSRGAASLLVATKFSVISAGTEKAVTELGAKSLAGKARARPDLVRKVVESASQEGVRTAYEKVRGRLAEPYPLGYSSCGVVLEAPDHSPAGPGELVACAGAGYAAHAEVVAVPRTLCARLPSGVAPEDAAYSTVVAIALHGLRLCDLRIGEVAAVIGLGLIGQLTLDLVAAAGCVALGVDPDPQRVERAQAAGFFATTDAADLVDEAARRTAGRGADGVLVTAASSDAAPLTNAVEAARERATVCVVGDVPIESARTPLFAKELRLVVSRSYGPGRYDPNYEERGVDYPAGYVRWTEGRNLEEALRLMAEGVLRPDRLTTHRFALEEGARAYELLEDTEPSLGIVLRYPATAEAHRRSLALERRPSLPHRVAARKPGPRLGVIGAGTFARTVLLPLLARQAEIATVVTATGSSAQASAARFGARRAGTDPKLVFEDEQIDAVLVATRHNTHAEYATRGLAAGKHVFVEKPPAIAEDGLRELQAAASAPDAPTLTVGFNRRFAPLAQLLRALLGGDGPRVITYRVSAGRLPRTHWLHDPGVGGGRIVGELCHFVDFASFLCDDAPTTASAVALEGSSEPRDDSLVATLAFPGGSVAAITYSALGDAALPKERVEVLAETGAATLDDFRELRLYRHGQVETERRRRDKGHRAEMVAFVEACRSGAPAQEVAVTMAVMRATFDVRDAVAGVSSSAPG